MIIYLEQTLAVLFQKDPEKTNNLVQRGTIKEYNGIRYLVIDDNLKK